MVSVCYLICCHSNAEEIVLSDQLLFYDKLDTVTKRIDR